MQAVTIGTVPLDKLAVRVVIGHYPHRNELLVDCGFTGISHDGIGVLDGSTCIIQDHPELR